MTSQAHLIAPAAASAPSQRLVLLRRLVALGALVTLGILSPGCNNGSTTSPTGFNLTINFTGFDSEVGKPFKLRVFDVTANEQTGSLSVASIPAASFTESISGALFLRDDFHVDFYVDENANNAYDAPPADHAWRIEIDNPTDNVNGTFDHSTAQTDVQFP